MVRIFRGASQRAKDAISRRGKRRPLNLNNGNTFGQTPDDYSENRGYGENVMNEEQLGRDLISLEGEELERAIKAIAQYIDQSGDSSLIDTFYKIADKHRILAEEIDIDSERRFHYNLFSKYEDIANEIGDKVDEIIAQRQPQTPPAPATPPAHPQFDAEAFDLVNECYDRKTIIYVDYVENFKLNSPEYSQEMARIDRRIDDFFATRPDLTEVDKANIIDDARNYQITSKLIPNFGRDGLDFINNFYNRGNSYFNDLCQMMEDLSTYQTVTDEFATKYEEFQNYISQIKPIAATKGVDISFDLTEGISVDFQEGTIGKISKVFLQPNVVDEITNGALLGRSQVPNPGAPAPAGAPLGGSRQQPPVPAPVPAGAPLGGSGQQPPVPAPVPAGAPLGGSRQQPPVPAPVPAGAPLGGSGQQPPVPAPSSNPTPDNDLLDYQAQVDYYNSLVEELNGLNSMIATTTISDTFSENMVKRAIDQEKEAQEQENNLRQQRLELSKLRLKYVQTHHKYIDVNAYKLAEPTFGTGMTLEQSSNIENDLAMRIEARVADLSQERENNKNNQIVVIEATRQISLMVALLESRNSYMSRRIVSEGKGNPNFNLGEFLQNRLNERKDKRALLRKAINGEVVDFQMLTAQAPEPAAPVPEPAPAPAAPNGDNLRQSTGAPDLDNTEDVKIVRFQLNPNPNLPSKINRRQATIVQSVDPVTKAIAKNKIKIQFSSGLKEALKNLSAKLSIVSKINPTQSSSITIDPTADSLEISTPDGSDIKDYEMQISVDKGGQSEIQYQRDLEDIVSKARTR